MAELTPADVQTYTSGRLSASEPEVQAMLDAALVTARRHVGWHVSPVKEADEITIDGPDSRVLWLPTRKLVALTAVSENGTALDVSTIGISVGDGPEQSRPIALRKRSGGFWTSNYGGIEVTMTHGYTETEAADWRRAIMAMVDQMSLLPVAAATGTSPFGVSSIRVDDVAYGYRAYDAMAEEVLFSVMPTLNGYALPRMEFI